MGPGMKTHLEEFSFGSKMGMGKEGLSLILVEPLVIIVLAYRCPLWGFVSEEKLIELRNDQRGKALPIRK